MITMSAPVSITPSAGTPCTQARWGLLPLLVSWICLHPLNLKVRIDHRGLAIQGLGLTRYWKCLAHMLYVVVQRQGEEVYQYTDFQLILWRDSSGLNAVGLKESDVSEHTCICSWHFLNGDTGQFASPKKLRIECGKWAANGHDHLYLLYFNYLWNIAHQPHSLSFLTLAVLGMLVPWRRMFLSHFQHLLVNQCLVITVSTSYLDTNRVQGMT